MTQRHTPELIQQHRWENFRIRIGNFSPCRRAIQEVLVGLQFRLYRQPPVSKKLLPITGKRTSPRLIFCACGDKLPPQFLKVSTCPTNFAIKNSALCPRSVFTFCTGFRTSSDYLSTQNYVAGFQARSQNSEKRLLASSRLSVWNNSAPTGRIIMKFDTEHFLKLCREHSRFTEI